MINYYLLTKPGIILGNLFTVTAGFLLASKGKLDYGLFFATLLGLGCIIASSAVFNNYINRVEDKKMERTKNRALVTGAISSRNAIIFAVCLGIIGTLILSIYTNFLTVSVAAVGFFIYVILYSFWKSHTIYGTAIGSIAGALPPVVGYCAASNHFDLGACILFLIMVLWQMPHFFAIAIYHFDDYAAANMPLLPMKKGVWRTKVHMVVYILTGYTGYVYLFFTTILGFLWLALCLQGFTSTNDQLWGKNMFRISLVVIMTMCFLIPLDKVNQL
jgi:protoheme IX farnesyltransferase